MRECHPSPSSLGTNAGVLHRKGASVSSPNLLSATLPPALTDARTRNATYTSGEAYLFFILPDRTTLGTHYAAGRYAEVSDSLSAPPIWRPAARPADLSQRPTAASTPHRSRIPSAARCRRQNGSSQWPFPEATAVGFPPVTHRHHSDPPSTIQQSNHPPCMIFHT